MKRQHKLVSSVLLLIVFLALSGTWLQREAIYDWLRLRGYAPPIAVQKLADETTMTNPARHLFYVNQPQIQDKTGFNSSCPNNGGEQTIVLGCYHDHQTGIFLFNVTDAQLNGVLQVTAAHETLHAIYERLSTKERNYVDGLLNDYYKNELHDERLIKTIDAYKKTEPNDLVNEMHSIFGTEVASLPPALESYYAKHFTDRQKVVGYAQQYQQVFTSRQNLIAKYDSQLASLKNQIDTNKSDLDAKQTALNVQRQQLDNYLAADNTEAYNAGVPAYNQQVKSFNAQVASTQRLIDQYNELVKTRNDVAAQTQQLMQELNSNALSTQQQR
jgi:hypothetical protein